ncbi:MAG: flagellar biosynthetic protein FliO [Candidatus Kapabacteria bacterium]|nr:flagellar biosynthetic protein FliO [Candidatus Kapabacteria bacterium]MCS7170165.1 flagellar biosynthetic protein FliO [Candidatus Kapabacteria bacterium]MDW7996339.1 flagellar biosynthetic protein FliO [Bacteroidota bacterium]MDW8225021.1 flagellar biosynthetic protein FliO [Bacteroidota bacterium]
MDEGVLIRTVLILIAFFTLLLAAAYGIRRWAWGGGNRNGLRLRLLARLPIAPKAALYAVRVGEVVFLLGVTEHSISVLRQYTVEEWEAARVSETSPTEPLRLLWSRRGSAQT